MGYIGLKILQNQLNREEGVNFTIWDVKVDSPEIKNINNLLPTFQK